MIGFWIFVIGAAGSFLAMFSLGRDLVRKKRARPRLVILVGVVREMKTNVSTTNTGGTRGYTVVKVEFVVNGMMYVCNTLRLFTGNHQYKDVGQLYDFPAGKEVGLFYDPADPRICALIVDEPRYFPVILFAVGGIVFLALAWGVWQRTGGG